MLALYPATDASAPADLSVVGGRYVASGRDLATAAWLTLYLDAPARPGDPVPDGAQSRGYWAQAALPAGDVVGSRWWTLRGSQAVTETLRRAEEIVEEAFRSWVARGWASNVAVQEAYFRTHNGTTLLVCPFVLHAPDGGSEAFDAWAEVA